VKRMETYTSSGRTAWLFPVDEHGTRLIEKPGPCGVRKRICRPQGLPFGEKSYEHSQCSEHRRRSEALPGRQLPGLSLRLCHGGARASPTTGRDPRRLDTLIRSLVKNGVKPGSNVYAEFGQHLALLMRDPGQAAHALESSLIAARATSCGAPIPSGTARRKTRSRHSVLSRSPRPCARSTATRNHAATAREGLRPERGEDLRVERRGSEEIHARDAIAAERLAVRRACGAKLRTTGPRPGNQFLDLLRNGAP